MKKQPNIGKELAVATGVKREENEDEQAYLLRLVTGVADLPQEAWDKLSDDAQAWHGKAVEDVNGGLAIRGFSCASDSETPPAQLPTAVVPPKRKESKGVDLRIISIVSANNPKRGSAAKRFALYRTGMTITEYLAVGGRRQDIVWDAKKGFISVK